jgi:hypothetical protein
LTQRPSQHRTARGLLAGLALVAGLTGAAPAGAQAGPLESAVKATFLYKFAPFVEWPPRALGTSEQPMIFCVQGDDGFAATLERAVAGQRVAGRALSVRRLGRVGRESGCHVLYAAGSRAQSAADAVRSVAGAPVLSVTDEARGSAHGIIHFVLKDNRVRFEIDEVAAAQSGLLISSKLLSLATKVRTRG